MPPLIGPLCVVAAGWSVEPSARGPQPEPNPQPVAAAQNSDYRSYQSYKSYRSY